MIVLIMGLAAADRLRLIAEKGTSNFSHPLGVKPKHRKIVRTFGQVQPVQNCSKCPLDSHISAQCPTALLA